MEKGTTGKSESGKGSKEQGNSFFDSVANIQEIAAYNARAPLETEDQVLLFLQSWWSKTYQRPLKDPLLQSYTIEELLYEFYDRIERDKAVIELTKQEADKIEETKEKDVLDWAEQEELRELEELKKKPDPTKDLNNIKWMEDQMEEQKKIFGEDFGEDLSLSLDE